MDTPPITNKEKRRAEIEKRLLAVEFFNTEAKKELKKVTDAIEIKSKEGETPEKDIDPWDINLPGHEEIPEETFLGDLELPDENDDWLDDLNLDEEETAPENLEEGEVDKIRNEYFNLKKTKKDKKSHELGKYHIDLKTAENAYQATKNKTVKEFLEKGEKEKAQEFLLHEVELKRKNDLENGFLATRIKTGISKGITRWEGIGNNPEDSKTIRFLKQTGKTIASVAIIGGASAGVVSALSTVGIGTASAVSAGYFGKRIFTSVGFSTAISVLPDSLKPFASKLAVGLAATSMAGIAGYGASKLSGLATKKWLSEKAIAEKTKEKIGKLEINLNTLNADLIKLEQECEKIIKEAEKKRTYRRLINGTVALTIGTAFLEVTGQGIDSMEAQHQAGLKHEAGLKNQTELQNDHTKPTETQLNNAKSAPAEVNQPSTPTNTEPIPSVENAPVGDSQPNTPENAFHTESVTFDHGKGGIQGILDLKTQMREHYHNDFSHAPKSVQDFMAETNVTKQAIQLGFFKPGESAESAMILKGSTLQFDDHGNLSFHDAKGGDNILIHGEADNSGNIPASEKYHGKMFDSDGNTKISTPEHHDSTTTTATEPTIQSEPMPETKPESAHTQAVQEKTDEIKAQLTAKEAPGTVHTGRAYGTGTPVDTGVDALNTGRIIGTGGGNGYQQFQNLSFQDKLTIENHPEFFKSNPYGLSGEDLMRVYETSHQDLDYLFGENSSTLSTLSSALELKASEVLEYENQTYVDPVAGQLSNYLNSLRRFTGLEPKMGILGGVGAENSEYYIARCLQKLTADGKLEDFEENLRIE